MAPMIKLTLTPHTQPITYIFEKNTVIIGSFATPGSLPDLALSQDDVQSVHIKIFFSGNNFIAFNVAEDPFSTINDFPFAKKVLTQGDFLQIGSTLLQFKGFHQEIQNSDASHDDSFLLQMVDARIHKTSDSTPPSAEMDSFNLEAALNDLDSWELDVLSDAEVFLTTEANPISANLDSIRPIQSQLSDIELEELMLRVEDLEMYPQVQLDQLDIDESNEPSTIFLEASTPKVEDKPILTSIDENKTHLPSENEPAASLNVQDEENESQQILSQPLPLTRSKSMKDDFSNDEETSFKKDNDPNQGSLFFSITWKEFLLSLGAFGFLFAIVLGCFYVAIAGHNEEEEIKAAQAVADVAMALNFAQINHAKPQNQNWSDPDFLKHNLTAVLASEFPPLANVDSQGHFYKTSYILRIYTGDDLNHFLIIAQPIPSLLQWFMPKAAITVDSTLMELRKISDLKTLNRLLVNVTLDTSNSTDIANFVRLGELFPLVELKKYHPYTGFDLPKALAYIRPGAENLIYNGVRYYPFGESLMKKAIALYKSDDNGQDLLPLIDEINRFTQFPNIVLYSSEGMKKAERGQRALATFFPRYKFLHAYLQFNSEHFPYNSHLLIDDSGEELVATSSEETIDASSKQSEEQPEQIAFNSTDKVEHQVLTLIPTKEKEAEVEKHSLQMNSEKEIDQNHPLYYKLMVLRQARDHSLTTLKEEEARQENQDNWENQNSRNAHRERHRVIINNLQEKIIRAISALQQEYATMPFGQFMIYVQEAGLESLIDENLQNRPETLENLLYFENTFQNQLLKIHESISLKKLYFNLKHLLHLLTLENVPDPKIFIWYQNLIRSTTLNRLELLLLSPDQSLPATDLKDENRTVISNILKAAWVTDEGEHDYYVNEFNYLLLGS